MKLKRPKTPLDPDLVLLALALVTLALVLTGNA